MERVGPQVSLCPPGQNSGISNTSFLCCVVGSASLLSATAIFWRLAIVRTLLAFLSGSIEPKGGLQVVYLPQNTQKQTCFRRWLWVRCSGVVRASPPIDPNTQTPKRGTVLPNGHWWLGCDPKLGCDGPKTDHPHIFQSPNRPRVHDTRLL